ncbi:hypothetical protein CEXT_387471 [Caerostris extrusa]|uniref:Uncharacterized protein n=1 Tax=Caerostris extrusa TaxID=172846 RepID=A0AAV4P4P9_CAEEX|nr:hypothetical protein CEXT_387471 [Caerostris extrusa]
MNGIIHGRNGKNKVLWQRHTQSDGFRCRFWKGVQEIKVSNFGKIEIVPTSQQVLNPGPQNVLQMKNSKEKEYAKIFIRPDIREKRESVPGKGSK